MHEPSNLSLRIENGQVSVVETLSLEQAKERTQSQRRIAYSQALSAILSGTPRAVLNPVAVVIRSGILCTPQTLHAQEQPLAYLDSEEITKLKQVVNLEHNLERYQRQTTSRPAPR